MSEKTFNGVRIINKHDVETNWLKAINFTPRQGELIVYDKDENYDYQRIKIGDGVTNVNDLPFYAGSWDDLDNKPFYEEGLAPITWDGNTEGLESEGTGMSMSCYKMAEDYSYLEPADFVGATYKTSSGNETIITEECLSEDGLSIEVNVGGYIHFAFVKEGGTATYIGSRPGLWLYKHFYGEYISEIVFPTTIVHIDSKFIGDDIARVQSAQSALELLMEMDIVNPTADENGAVYTDENNIIYVL